MNYEAIVSEGFSGVISYSENGRTIIRNTYGYGDLPNKREINDRTKFAMSTASKAFVACGIMKLIEKGSITLDSKIGRIVEHHLGKIDRTVTIRELLNHTSGVPDYFYTSEMGNFDKLFHDFPNYRFRTPADVLQLFINKPMNEAQFGQFAYKNSGYVLLALVIEGATGLPFTEFLKKEIFEPLRMYETGYYEMDRLPENCAINYIYDEQKDEYYSNIYCAEVVGTGAGGAYTTVLDMEKFWFGLRNKFMPGKLVNQMLSPQIDEGYYGYGFWLRGDCPMIQGAEPGVSFISTFNNSTGEIVTIASNHGNNVWGLLDSILDEDEEEQVVVKRSK